MFEKFTAEGAGDFRQRYQGTYGFFVDNGKKTLTRLSSINADGKRSSVEFEDKDGVKYYLMPDSKDDSVGFEFIPPKNAWYNTKEGIPVLLSRIPARQYLRGICDRNTKIEDITQRLRSVDFTNLIELFETKTSIKDALAAAQLILGKKRGAGIALSEAFAIGLAEQQIKCFNTSIGSCEYKDGLFKIELDSPELWIVEVTDACKRAGLNAEVS